MLDSLNRASSTPAILRAEPMKPFFAAARFWPRLYLPLIVALCCVQTWRALSGGDDFWAHAAIGRWIAAHGEVPQRTLFLWGAQQPWIAHSWGTQFWFYELMKVGGERGGPYLALVFACLMLSLCFVILWREWARRGQISTITVLFFALATVCAQTRSRPRPELFSSVFFTILLVHLIGMRRRDTLSWRDGLIVLMFVAWTNLHGQVAAGLLLLALTALCDAVQAWFEKSDWRPAMRCGALFLACAAAINCNPYGWHYWSALRPVGGPMFAHIDEWKKLWEAPTLDVFFPVSAILTAVFALIAWLGVAKRRWAYGAWLLVWMALLLTARRYLWMLSLVSLAVLAAHAEAIAPQVFWRAARRVLWKEQAVAEIPALWRSGARWTTIAFLVAVIAQQTPQAWLQHGPRAVSKHLPASAATKLVQLARRRPGLRVFNDYEFSSYLQWRCAGAPPLFIDLLNAYPDQLLFDYFDILKATPKGRKMLAARRVNCVFLRHHTAKDGMAKLARFLDKSPAWRRVYSGADASIWLKK